MAIERKIPNTSEGTVYRFSELTGWDGYEALQLLMKVAGPFLPLLNAAGGKVADDGKASDEQRTSEIINRLPQVLAGHDAEATRKLLDMLIANVTIGGQPAVIGVRPQGLDEMFAVFALCLEGQFVPFFQGETLGRLLAMLPADAAEAA